jgi:hypothetical protein
LILNSFSCLSGKSKLPLDKLSVGATSRLLAANQLPFSVVSDGKTAIVLDTVSGKKLGEGLNAILSKEEAQEKLKAIKPVPFPQEKREREKLIFRSYDSMNVNVCRNIQ